MVTYLTGTAGPAIENAWVSLMASVIAIISDSVGTIAKVMGDLVHLNATQAIKDMQSSAAGQAVAHAALVAQHRAASFAAGYSKTRAAGPLDAAARAAGTKAKGDRSGHYGQTSMLPAQRQTTAMLPAPARGASGQVAYNVTNNITVNGATGADHAALAQTIKKTIDTQNNRDLPRALRQNGGLSTTPWLPQGFVT